MVFFFCGDETFMYWEQSLNKVQSAGGISSFQKISSGVYLISTNEGQTANSMYDFIRNTLISPYPRFIISHVDPNNIQGWHAKSTWDFINAYR